MKLHAVSVQSKATISQCVDSHTSLIPQWDYLTEFKTANKTFKGQQKKNFDDSHHVHNLPDIPDNTDAWITTDGPNTPGMTVRGAEAPRSYIVQAFAGEVCRNRSQLNINLPQQQTLNQLQTAIVLS